MPHKQTLLAKANFFQTFLGLACLSFVAACSEQNGMTSHVFGDSDVPRDVLQQPRLVAAPTQEEMQTKDWLRLGDVPSKPQDFSSAEDIQKKKEAMAGLRAEGDAIHAAHPELYEEDVLQAPSPPTQQGR